MRDRIRLAFARLRRTRLMHWIRHSLHRAVGAFKTHLGGGVWEYECVICRYTWKLDGR